MNKNFVIFLTILCITTLTLTKLLTTNKLFLLKEYFEFDNNLFVDKETSYNNIINSNYFKDLNGINLEARGCKDINECRKIYQENLSEFNSEEKEKIINLLKHADDITKDFNKFHKIPWRIAKTSEKIENGFPFTIGNIIYISDDFFDRSRKYKLQTIIHEKLHVFQRKYQKDTHKLYYDLNFIKLKLINDPLRRHNPDLDNFDYEYKGVRIYNKFNNDKPKSLSDSKTVYLPYTKNIVNQMINRKYNNEHPNEIFANIISRQIVKNKIDKNFIEYLS